MLRRKLQQHHILCQKYGIDNDFNNDSGDEDGSGQEDNKGGLNPEEPGEQSQQANSVNFVSSTKVQPLSIDMEQNRN